MISSSYLTDEFDNRVKEFLNFAYSHLEVVDHGKIRCPCSKCRNMRFDNRDNVHYHLKRYGFERGYNRWDAHREPWIPKSMGESSSRGGNDENIGIHAMVIDAAGP